MQRDELIYNFSVAVRKCEAVRNALLRVIELSMRLPEKLDYQDTDQLRSQTYAIEFQQLLRYCLKSDISYLKKRTEELANEHGSN